MAMVFNASEVLEVAIRIEENAARFYRNAAALKGKEANLDFLGSLAVMEEEHAEVFRNMAVELGREESLEMQYDLDDLGGRYLRALADGQEVEGSPRATDALTASMTIPQILDVAIALEKEAISFYCALQESVPHHLGKDKVAEITQAERDHVRLLEQKRRAVHRPQRV